MTNAQTDPSTVVEIPEPTLGVHPDTPLALVKADNVVSEEIYQEVQACYEQARAEGWLPPSAPMDRCMVGLTVMLVMSRIDDLMNMSWGTPQAAMAALRALLT